MGVNECLSNNGGCDSKRTCINTEGGRTCGDCPSGYANDGDAGCKDANECLSNNGGCDSKRTCINTEGGRTCGDCPSGYVNDGDTGCKAVTTEQSPPRVWVEVASKFKCEGDG